MAAEHVDRWCPHGAGAAAHHRPQAQERSAPLYLPWLNRFIAASLGFALKVRVVWEGCVVGLGGDSMLLSRHTESRRSRDSKPPGPC